MSEEATPPPFGLDAANLRVLILLELLFAFAHQALGAALLFLLGDLGDTRTAWIGLAAVLAATLLASERLMTGHTRTALTLATVAAATCLLADAYVFTLGEGRG